MSDEMIIVSREPIHPGEFLREEYMPELGLSVAKLADRLGVTRQTVNDIVRERRALSPDMCLRLGRLFGTTPQFWMNMQAKVDLWNSLELHRDDIEAIEPIAAVAAG
ncbi:MAG: HigA family addiction module antitoxin [Coriobacteriales bacterium]